MAVGALEMRWVRPGHPGEKGPAGGGGQPPRAQADLSTFSPVLSLRASRRQSSDTTWSCRHQRTSPAHALPSPAFPACPLPSPALPSFLCRLGRDLQTLLGGREGALARGWEGTFLQRV